MNAEYTSFIIDQIVLLYFSNTAISIVQKLTIIV